MPEFEFTEIFPLGKDTTPYRLVTTEGVSTFDTPEGTFLKVSPEAITRITQEAMRDIAHFLRPATYNNYATFSMTPKPVTTIALLRLIF